MSPELISDAISEAKLEANRANAQLSTGPTSAEGKKRSSKNAFRHGLTGQVALMPDEDREEFTRFCDAIVADYHAEGPIETQLAQSIAEAQGPPDAAPKNGETHSSSRDSAAVTCAYFSKDFWRLNRGRAWETNMLALGYFDGTADRFDTDHPQISDAMAQVGVFEKQGKNFSLIALYETRINRNIAKNEQRLAARQAERRAAFEQAVQEAKLLREEEATEAAETKAETTHIVVRGFVFSTPEIHIAVDRRIRLERARLNQPKPAERTLKAA